jgi:lipopolysaccharide/colanic/teichoic acid biosynthesis glycosyltransferase
MGMGPSKSSVNGASTSTLVRTAGSAGSNGDPVHPRVVGGSHKDSPRALANREPREERASRPTVSLSNSTDRVLSAREFECFLERERSLADRGTRRFSLLVLRRRAGAPAESRARDALAELARQGCKRLRSTDLVGRPDADRVEILLTDTQPAGAQVVAAWVERIEATLGLDLEHRIYVYPSVAEASADWEQDSGPSRNHPHEKVRTDGSGNGRLTRDRVGAASTHVAVVAENGTASKGKSRDAQHNGHSLPTAHDTSVRADRVASEGPRPMEDLWPLLGDPTPLGKRSLDILVSALALLVLLPLLVLIAIAIRLDSRGPVIFRQMRAGRGGRPFVFYKFRSMIADAEEQRRSLAGQNEQDGPIFKIRKDPRITRVGRLLRRSSMDELPQLWNVLKGDISLVGPRSPTLDEVRQYERWQRRRLCVTGGITCTWQVSGRNRIPFLDWMRLDIRYVTCRNLWLDLRLLVLTLPAVISGRGAC